MQSLNLSIADLLGRPGEYRDFSLAHTLTGVGTALAAVDEAPVRADLKAESVVEGVLVTGQVEGTAQVRCARCLTETDVDLSLRLCELFVAPGNELAKNEEAYRISGTEIHLEPMLRDAVALELPLNPLCNDDCRGLCARCGRNLNRETCNCTEEQTDPRWAELAALRERLS